MGMWGIPTSHTRGEIKLKKLTHDRTKHHKLIYSMDEQLEKQLKIHKLRQILNAWKTAARYIKQQKYNMGNTTNTVHKRNQKGTKIKNIWMCWENPTSRQRRTNISTIQKTHNACAKTDTKICRQDQTKEEHNTRKDANACANQANHAPMGHKKIRAIRPIAARRSIQERYEANLAVSKMLKGGTRQTLRPNKVWRGASKKYTRTPYKMDWMGAIKLYRTRGQSKFQSNACTRWTLGNRCKPNK